MSSSIVTIEPVETRRQLAQVIKFPFALYRDDPNWVPPLIAERFKHFDPEHNPFFEHAEMRMFRAVRNGQTVGTIAAISDSLHPKVWDENVGFFGVYETIDDPIVSTALLDAARDWLSDQGRDVMRGPMDLNINDECGLLIDGHDGTPVIMMTYHPPYYQTLLEDYGMVKAKDMYAYKVDIASYGPNAQDLPDRIHRVAAIARDRYGVSIRKVDMAHLDREVELIRPIHRQAWNENWGALPMSDAEYAYLKQALEQVLDPDLTYLAFIDDEPVGCFICLPDLNQVVKHMNGRMLPIGWAKYLWHRRKVNGMRVLIMGVLKEHRLKGIEGLFYEMGAPICAQKGYEWAEMSWILEDNYKVSRGIEMMGGKPYRQYRIYDVPTAR